ncbi:MAG: hypothetical protein H6739_35895 [Alphaproteobacteria bacterium]|nr:hypothetical protein [Alphaproteobacteria bacterium]
MKKNQDRGYASPDRRPPGAEDALPLSIQHLGMSGLRLVLAGEGLCVDPPAPVQEPVLVTWSEAERVAGAVRGGLLALPEVLRWLGRGGVALDAARAVRWGELRIAVRPYRPIPYATPPEAARKALIALRRPRFAARRLAHTLRRPGDPPLAVRLDWRGVRIALCQQALHRFVSRDESDALRAFFAGSVVAIASPDFEDEEACGRLLADLGAAHNVLIDSIGPVRRMLGLPTRPLSTSLPWAPAGTLLLEDGERLALAVERRAVGSPPARVS